MKNVWSPASASVRVSASIQPSAPSISGAICPSRVGHALPVDDRRVAGGEAARELLLLGAEEADREPAGAAQELVAGSVLADRDADQRRLERERDERGDGDAHPVALDVDAEDRDAVRPEPHQAAEIVSRRHG